MDKIKQNIENLCGEDFDKIDNEVMDEMRDLIDNCLSHISINRYISSYWIGTDNLIEFLGNEDFILIENPLYNCGETITDLYKKFSLLARHFKYELQTDKIDYGVTDFLIYLTLKSKIGELCECFEHLSDISLADYLQLFVLTSDDMNIGDMPNLKVIYECQKQLMTKQLLVKYVKEANSHE
ncbi:hypothetical protein EQ500_01655 [Lactobacillus sp. XV13L]|nr:hypothetical protein [Lactobacillus sp. XV13L]